jgi:hypothetical protein
MLFNRRMWRPVAVTVLRKTRESLTPASAATDHVTPVGPDVAFHPDGVEPVRNSENVVWYVVPDNDGIAVTITVVALEIAVLGSVAVTWYVPGPVPAVNTPELLIVPPVAVHVTAGDVVEPSLIVPIAWN